MMPPVLILAGGKATRMKAMAAQTPKYLMPVNAHQTFADIHLDWHSKHGFRRVFLSIGHLGEQIKNYCGDGEKWGLDIKYVEDGEHPLGTGGAVRKALQYEFDELCITYGDTLLNFSIPDFLDQFRKFNCLGALTIYENKVPGHICNADFDSPWVIYDKLKPQSDWKYLDYGFMILKRSLIEGFSKQTPLDLAQPLSESSRQKKLLGFVARERFWEIGSPEALSEFQQALNMTQSS